MVKEPMDRYSMGLIDSFCHVFKRMMENHLIRNASIDWVRALEPVTRAFNTHHIHIRAKTVQGFARIPKDREGKAQAHTVSASPQQLRDSADSRNPVLFNAAHMNDEERGYAGLRRMLQFKVGDKVRIRLRPEEQPRDRSKLNKPGKAVAKGSQRWSNRVYTIHKIENLSFELVDSAAKAVARSARGAETTYRQHDLMKVPPDSIDVPDIRERAAKESRREKRKKREDLD
jgi:hypothetical protein